MKKVQKSAALCLALVSLLIVLGGCGSSAPGTSTPPPSEQESVETAAGSTLTLSSTAFAHGESIPAEYSCDGQDVSPPLQWSDPPQAAQSFVLIADDPDAPGGTWVHWVVYNLPAGARSLPGSIPPEAEFADGGQHGQNSWGRLAYGGPCPPGGTHRYFFKLYALDTTLELEPGASKEQVLQAMEGHVLAQGELMGTFSR